MKRSSKISLTACVVILAVAAGIGWQDRRRLISACQRNASVVSEAAALGISTSSANGREPVVYTKRSRDTPEERAKRELEEVWSMLNAADAAVKGGMDSGAEAEKILECLMSLSPAGTELVIASLIEDTSIDHDDRVDLLGFLLTKLTTDSPQTLLKLLPKLSGISGDEAEDKRVCEMFASSALANWGKNDPMAVATWIRTNGAGFPGGIDEGKKQVILAGAAAKDSGVAFRLIREIGISDLGQAILSITRAAKGPEGKTTALAELRTHLASVDSGGKDEMLHEGIGQLAAGTFKEGFIPASKWLAGAGFSSEEMATAASKLEYFHTINETGQWLDWLGQKLPPDKVDGPVCKIMGRWTEMDYQAAGNWLASAPEGPAKKSSVQAYAATISKYEPETAAQWAMSLPAGKEREECLRTILGNWPDADAAAKEAFAKEHGIE